MKLWHWVALGIGAYFAFCIWVGVHFKDKGEEQGMESYVVAGRSLSSSQAQSIGESTRDIPGGRPPAPAGYGGQYDIAPAYGDIDPTRRERSGALR